MDHLITLAEFATSIEIKYNLLKDLLDQAGIKYVVVNENARDVEPFAITSSNIAIEIKILESDAEQALKLLESIL